jgi:fructokinase
MNKRSEIYIFGEVLFDCFPTGEQVLGGAPFNVAWHLQALGDRPQLISRIGKDMYGDRILQAMHSWGLSTTEIQIDTGHPTGRVEVTFNDNEPSYEIVPDSAFDFISAQQLGGPLAGGILYHGTLCLRNEPSRITLREIVQNRNLKIFLDVNLRSPWWRPEEVCSWLKNATWVKMNHEELSLLSCQSTDIHQQMQTLQATYELEQLIVTRGAQGALVRTSKGKFHTMAPQNSTQMIDTVGAGDAFSAVYIHGLCAGWSIDEILFQAQRFASQVITVRGATIADRTFYKNFIDALDL